MKDAPRFGFRTASLRQASTEQAAAELARLGYDCLELCLEASDVRPEAMTEARARALRQRLDDLGIGLASLSYHADREPPDQRAANQARAIQAAQWMGAVISIENGADRRRSIGASDHVPGGILCD